MPSPKNSIARLCQYRSVLNRAKDLGFQSVFSDYLAEETGYSSSLIRKDFSLFGIPGRKRGGYNLNALSSNLDTLFCKHETQEVILVGAGNIGSALMRYKNFEAQKIRIVAGFDVDRSKHSSKNPVPILPIDTLESFVKERNIKIGILAVPDSVAQKTAEQMVEAGIEGILNFAPIQVKTKSSCLVHDVNLAIELEKLIYFVNGRKAPFFCENSE